MRRSNLKSRDESRYPSWNDAIYIKHFLVIFRLIVPSAPPTNVRVLVINDTAVSVNFTSPPQELWNGKLIYIVVSFLEIALILMHFMSLVSFYNTPWKHKNQRFSDVFSGYRKRLVTWNGLIKIPTCLANTCSKS